MPTGLVQRPRSRYIDLFLVMYGPGAAMEKQDHYNHLSRDKLYANNDSLCEQVISHMPGTFFIPSSQHPLLSPSFKKKQRHEQDRGTCMIRKHLEI